MSSEMVILIAPGDTPSGFGLRQNGDRLEIISPCCGELVVYDFDGNKRPTFGPSRGAPLGVAYVFCGRCDIAYKGYSNSVYPLDVSAKWLERFGMNWLEPWTGLKDVTIEVKL